MSNINISFNPLAWSIRPLYEQAKAEDATFARLVAQKEARADKPKSLGECADYILGEAYDWAVNHKLTSSFGYSGLPDSEVVRLIQHYYTEENIEIKKITGAKASVATASEKKKEEPKKAKVVKMQTPATATGLFAQQKQEPKKESETFDLFAGMWNEEETEEKEAVEDDDDLPL